MKLSVAIPTYEMKGQGVSFLRRNLDSIHRQTLNNAVIAEVVISDHSQNHDIEDFAKQYSANFPIQYYKNVHSRGSISANTNFAIQQCTGEYVKILFQDDMLVEAHYLDSVSKILLDNPVDFILTGASHTHNGIKFYDEISPQTNEFILFGENTISSPSTLTIKQSLIKEIEFDNHLKLLMDCDFYHQLFSKNKTFVLAPQIHIANGVWAGQTHSNMNGLTVINEVQYLLRKYQSSPIAAQLEKYSLYLKTKDYHLAKSLNNLAINTNLRYGAIAKLAHKFAFHLKKA